MHGPEREAAARTGVSAAAHEPRSAALRAEVAWTVIVCATILAFMPLVPRASALSSEASPSRIMEIALLGLAFSAAVARVTASRLIAVLSANAGLFLVLLAFTVWAAVTAIVAGKSPTGVVKAAELAAVLLVAFACHADPRLRPASIPRVIALAVLAAAAILLAANIPIYGEFLPMRPTEGESRIRLFLGFNHPLASALMLAIGMVAVLFAGFRLAFLLAAEALLLPLFILCNARGLTVGIAAAALAALSLLARPVQRAALAVVSVVAALAGLVSISVHDSLLVELMAITDGDGATLNGRTELWSTILTIALEHPLTGVGYYNLRHYVLGTFHWAGAAHNSFLEILVGTGLVGGALFLGFALIWVARVASLQNGFLVALSPVMLVEAMLNSILFVPSFSFLVLLMGLAGPPSSPRTAGGIKPQPARRKQEPLGAAGAFAP